MEVEVQKTIEYTITINEQEAGWLEDAIAYRLALAVALGVERRRFLLGLSNSIESKSGL